MNKAKIIGTLIIVFLAVSCSNQSVEICDLTKDYINICSFETQFQTVEFEPSNDYHYESAVDNPHRRGLNRSSKCGKVISAGDPWEFIASKPLSRKLDFTKNAPIFRLKVLAPEAGCKVYMKLEPSEKERAKYQALELQSVTTTVAGRWEELVFDFTELKPESNVYNRLVILFDAGRADRAGQIWYFDDLIVPNDDLTSICLFQRYEGNPVFRPEGTQTWKDAHIANAAIISPADSPDGNWWLYIRGSGHTPDYHDQIGVYTQPADDFKPFGPWNEYEGNPVIPYGERGSYDEMYLLDCCPVVGKNGVFYMYYKARRYDFSSTTGCAYSTDGYHFTKLPEPWLEKGGACDAVYHDGKYYIFAGTRVSVTDNPLDCSHAKVYPTIGYGGGPSNFDSHILWGTMVFRLEGVDKWFMAYQASAFQYDFPDRFHIAVSDDLIHWTKVANNQPLFTRGSAGEWDQGGIWYPEIIEYQDKLYLYYEGWGREGYVANRNREYFSGGSCTGVAWVDKDAFLKWCGLK